MSEITEIQQKRENFNGKAIYIRFRNYCQKHDVEPTEEAIATWDQKYNKSLLLETWGDSFIYSVGLKELYRRFLNQYSTIVWKTVRGSIRVTSRRVVGPKGRKGFLETVTPAEVVYIKDKLKEDIKRLLETKRFFDLGFKKIRAIVSEAIDEMETEFRTADAAD